MTGQPAGPQPETLALGPDEPETQEQKKRLWCRYYWDNISPDDFVARGILSTRFDDAPWLGFRFTPIATISNANTAWRPHMMDDVN
jgi:hypothetical protein